MPEPEGSREAFAERRKLAAEKHPKDAMDLAEKLMGKTMPSVGHQHWGERLHKTFEKLLGKARTESGGAGSLLEARAAMLDLVPALTRETYLGLEEKERGAEAERAKELVAAAPEPDMEDTELLMEDAPERWECLEEFLAESRVLEETRRKLLAACTPRTGRLRPDVPGDVVESLAEGNPEDLKADMKEARMRVSQALSERSGLSPERSEALFLEGERNLQELVEQIRSYVEKQEEVVWEMIHGRAPDARGRLARESSGTLPKGPSEFDAEWMKVDVEPLARSLAMAMYPFDSQDMRDAARWIEARLLGKDPAAGAKETACPVPVWHEMSDADFENAMEFARDEFAGRGRWARKDVAAVKRRLDGFGAKGKVDLRFDLALVGSEMDMERSSYLPWQDRDKLLAGLASVGEGMMDGVACSAIPVAPGEEREDLDRRRMKAFSEDPSERAEAGLRELSEEERLERHLGDLAELLAKALLVDVPEGGHDGGMQVHLQDRLAGRLGKRTSGLEGHVATDLQSDRRNSFLFHAGLFAYGIGEEGFSEQALERLEKGLLGIGRELAEGGGGSRHGRDMAASSLEGMAKSLRDGAREHAAKAERKLSGRGDIDMEFKPAKDVRGPEVPVAERSARKRPENSMER